MMQDMFTFRVRRDFVYKGNRISPKRCALCGSPYRPEIDHINETHEDRSQENLWVLCKYHHSQKGLHKLRLDLFQLLIYEVDKDPKLRRTMRFFAEKRMLEYKDASNFPFRGGVGKEGGSDLYKKNEVAAMIGRIVREDGTQDL